MDKNLEKQKSLQNLPLVPGKQNYCEGAQLRPSPHNMLVFTDSIQKGIQKYELNSLLRNRKTQTLNFPGSSSKQMLHDVDMHLEDKSINTIILHAGVNDFLNDNSQSNVNNLNLQNHRKIENNRKM